MFEAKKVLEQLQAASPFFGPKAKQFSSQILQPQWFTCSWIKEIKTARTTPALNLLPGGFQAQDAVQIKGLATPQDQWQHWRPRSGRRQNSIVSIYVWVPVRGPNTARASKMQFKTVTMWRYVAEMFLFENVANVFLRGTIGGFSHHDTFVSN